MTLLEFLFNLGIVFIVLSMIWGFFMLLLKAITMGQRKGVFEEHFLRVINYALLATLTASFALKARVDSSIPIGFVIAGLVMLYLFVIGKMERQQMMAMFQGRFQPDSSAIKEKQNNLYLIGTLGLYAASIMVPEIAGNAITNWFMQSIIGIKETAVIGWILKVVGFFFLIAIIFRGFKRLRKLINKMNGIEEPKSPFESMFNQFKQQQGGPAQNNGYAETEDVEDYEIVEDDD